MMHRHLEIRSTCQRGGLAVLALLAGTWLGACAEPVEEGPPALRTVRTVTVEPTTAGTIRTFSGISKSELESRLSFKVAGTIEALPIEVGDGLRRGALVAELDASLYQLQAQQAEASLIQAQAAERNAAANYERVKGLYADNNASRNDLDTARANAESAEAQVRAAAKALELARLNTSYTRLTAAEDCTVAAVDVEVNENVGVGSTIATVTCGSQLEVELDMPESLISQVQRDMDVGVRFDALPDVTIDATVSEVGVMAGGSTAFPVTVSLVDPPAGLRSGLAAEVSFQFYSGSEEHGGGPRYLVPLSALVEDAGKRFVYVFEPGSGDQGTVRRRDVEVGQLTEMGMEIFAGLSNGDQVITAGTSLVRDGLEVAAPEGPSDPAAAAPAAETSTADGAQ